MRFVLVILVVAAAAGGWWWFKRGDAATVEQGEPVIPPGIGQEAPAATGSGTGGTGGLGTAVGAPAAAQPPPPEAQAAIDQAEALWQQINGDTANPNAPAVLALYSRALRELYGRPGQLEREQQLIATRLAPLGTAIFYSKTRYPKDAGGVLDVHVASPGENPNAIAKKYGMSEEFLNRLRGRQDPHDGRLSVGEAMKVVRVREKGGFAIHIDKSDFRLDVHIAGLFAKRYAISHGARETPTPTGRTRLTDRVWEPDWTHPVTHQVIKFGQPEHLLGKTWMPFNADELGQAGIGIHGYTGANAGTGQLASNGCIRLPNEDAEELYNTLSHPDRCPTEVLLVE